MHTFGQIAIPVVLVLLIVYRRIRRTIGYQPVQPRRLRVRIGIFAVVGLMLLAFGFLHPIVWAADAAGLAVGLVLAWFAIRHNEFEQRVTGLYFRTNTAVQAIVVALLIGRLAYRFLFISSATQASGNGQDQMQAYSRDPLTAGIFFVLVAFYIVYYAYVLRHGKERNGPENG